jgi:hypothetical protein
MDPAIEPISEEEMQCKQDAKEYFQLTQQIAELTRRRAEIAKRLIPSMNSLQHKSYRMANEGILAVQTTTRPKPFTASYLKSQLLPLLNNNEDTVAEFMRILSSNRAQAVDTRLIIKSCTAHKK